ncbi:hypothetical protein JKP88DRAFT_332640 [Tribonema minus]|uniref:Uncharacterized protein n=1 Tax=Tribonema minus TaxID=303371 RepID=A0A836CA43_9STRA|nr:hypothetical protein JKP88DRAFT_332640 [Tribonema minus]
MASPSAYDKLSLRSTNLDLIKQYNSGLAVWVAFFTFVQIDPAPSAMPISSQRRQQQRQRALAMVSPAAVAPTALLATSCGALWLEHRSEAAARAGSALLSFGSMCLLSNLGLVPAAHPAYDLCWSVLLPMSLATIVLGCPLTPQNPPVTGTTTQPQPQLQQARPRVGVPFAIGAAGSVAGVLAAFAVATCAAAPAAVRLPPSAAAAAAAALAATYIGGSANLFAVAAAVGLDGGVLSAIAAADVFLMAVYFALLVAAQKSAPLRRAFGSGGGGSSGGGDAQLEERSVGELAAARAPPPSPLRPLPLLLTLAAARAVCLCGDALQQSTGWPGAATAAITGLAAAAAAGLRAAAPAAAAAVAAIAPRAAGLLLTLFFGAMGAQGSWLANAAAAALPSRKPTTNPNQQQPQPLLSLDDVLVASNANIGGPGTAGAFASMIRRPDLVVSAAAWGTAGYALASSVGVALFALLSRAAR